MASAMIKYCFDLTKSHSTSQDSFVNFPFQPSSLDHEYMMITTNSSRTVGRGAYMHKEFLAMKNKFKITANYITPAQYTDVKNIFKEHNFIRVYLPDYGTLTVYGGDMSASGFMANSDGSLKAYRNFSWNLIER